MSVIDLDERCRGKIPKLLEKFDTGQDINWTPIDNELVNQIGVSFNNYNGQLACCHQPNNVAASCSNPLIKITEGKILFSCLLTRCDTSKAKQEYDLCQMFRFGCNNNRFAEDYFRKH